MGRQWTADRPRSRLAPQVRSVAVPPPAGGSLRSVRSPRRGRSYDGRNAPRHAPEGIMTAARPPAGQRLTHRRRCASRYLTTRRCPPRCAIAVRSDSIASASVARSQSQPRRSHSSSQSIGEECPRCPLHRRHAATSFSIHDGPPLTRGTRWSVVAGTSRPKPRPHHTHRSPSRPTMAANRSARCGCRRFGSWLTSPWFRSPAPPRCLVFALHGGVSFRLTAEGRRQLAVHP